MKAIMLEEYKKDLHITNVPDPILTEDGVIVEIKANGICRSDFHIWQGDWSGLSTPLIMGHEFTGIIKETGKNVKKFKVGDRIIVPFSLSCGSCEYCIDGHSNVCNERQSAGITFNGGYAEYAHVPLADLNLSILPNEIDFVSGAAMGCRFATSFHGIVDRAQVSPGEWVVVNGCGGVGLSAIQFSIAMGANVICIDIDDNKLQFAKKLGTDFIINSTKENVVETVLEITKGGAHVTVDALGLPEIISNSLQVLKKRGRHLQMGIPSESVNLEANIRTLVNKEHQILGSRGMQPQRFPYMLNMVKSEKIEPGVLVTEKVKAEQVNKVLKEMKTYNNTGISVLEW